MTVTATNPSIQYQGNSATTEFSFPFEAVTEEDLVVTLIVISSLTKSVLTLDVDYSVDLETGEVTYPLIGDPMNFTRALEIRRNAAYEQDTSYSTQGNFSPTTLEQALDYVTMLVQQVNQWLVGSSNVVRLPTFTVAGMPSALTAAPALIYVRDAAGGGIPCFSDGTNWRRVDTRGIVA